MTESAKSSETSFFVSAAILAGLALFMQLSSFHALADGIVAIGAAISGFWVGIEHQVVQWMPGSDFPQWLASWLAY